MNRQRVVLYVVLTFVLVLNVAAASLINLSGSDRGPYQESFPGQCAKPTVSVVYEQPDKPNAKVVEIDLTGDFSKCIGAQVLVTTFKTGHIHSYAVFDITSAQSTIQLSFVKKGGDFYQKFPGVVNGRLVSDGPLSPSSNSIDPSEISVLFAWSWS